MQNEMVKIKDEYILELEEEAKAAVTKRRALLLFSSRSKLESLRFFIV